MTGITEQLVHLCDQPVPEDAAAMMRLSLFDWAACGIAGAREQEFAGFVRAESAVSPGNCHLLGGGKAAPAAAALINGTLSHALDYDDTHFAHIGHPSVAVVPAVLALSEAGHADLGEVVAAATLGVEASVHVGLWLGRQHYQVGFHQTATAGAFGATIAAGRLCNLPAPVLRQALGLTASLASGIKAQFGTMAKPLNAGLAARSGVEAVTWAQAGMTAAADGLAGPLGFGPTHHGEGKAAHLPAGNWRITSISHKFHACCHGLHAMLEALSGVTVDPHTITAIRIRTHPRWMSVCNISTPKTGLAAKFSYGQTAAMALLGHETGAIASFTDSITQEPEIVTLREKVAVTADDRLSETEAEVLIERTDGAPLRLRHDLMTPMTGQERATKLRTKAAALLGAPQALSLWDAAQGNDLRQFIRQLDIS